LREIEDHTDKESLKRRRNIEHFLIESIFDIDRLLDALLTLYKNKPTGKLNDFYFEEYKKQVKIKHEK